MTEKCVYKSYGWKISLSRKKSRNLVQYEMNLLTAL